MRPWAWPTEQSGALLVARSKSWSCYSGSLSGRDTAPATRCRWRCSDRACWSGEQGGHPHLVQDGTESASGQRSHRQGPPTGGVVGAHTTTSTRVEASLKDPAILVTNAWAEGGPTTRVRLGSMLVWARRNASTASCGCCREIATWTLARRIVGSLAAPETLGSEHVPARRGRSTP